MTSPGEQRLTAPLRIGVDVGGTFTDMAVVDRLGSISVFKAPSTPADPSRGVIAAIEMAASALGVSCGELLGACDHFVHGSTIATNIVVERRNPPVGMLVTRGFRDSLEIRRGIRRNAWDHRTPFPPVLAPRYLRLPVGGRLDRHGREIEPLALDDIREAARTFRDEDVSAIAICLYNSFLNPEHEERAADALAAAYPEASVTISSRIAPVMGEYERGSTAVLNAYVASTVISYIRRLADELSERGLRTPLLIVQNNAGSLTVDKVEARPVSLLLSGPAAGVGALELYGRAAGEPNMISMEIGGTSCDVTLIAGAGAEVASEFDLGGYHVALPSVDIHSIGAGGGTIAGVDRAGMLFVGPHGAGASPGPAAYGLGGEEPTVTDAQLVLGRLKPGPLAGGRSLDLDLATRVIEERIARPLGLSVDEAAAGILRLLEQQVSHAVQKISAERGRDPRRFILVAAGGAGPMHGASIGRKLGSASVYVPRLAGAFCALGMLNAPVKHEFGRVFLAELGPEASRALGPVIAGLEEEARAQVTADSFPPAEVDIVLELELRYPGQLGTIRIKIVGGEAIDCGVVKTDFLAAHHRLYGHSDPAATIEVAGVRVIGIGRFPPLELPVAPLTGVAPPPAGERPVYFEEHGKIAAKVFHGQELLPGASFAGPAVIEEATTSVIVGPGDVCTVDALGNFAIRFEEGTAS